MKDIPGYEGIYAVTSCGKVWSYRNQKFLTPLPAGRGYYQVCLSKDGQKVKRYVHRLVAEAYIPNPLGLPQVNHKDEDKTNNNVNNLEWVTAKENNNYGTKNERASVSLGKPVVCIETGEVFHSARAAARATGANQAVISRVCRHKLNTAGGYHWKFYEEELLEN